MKPELIDFTRSQSLELHEFPLKVQMKDIVKQDAIYLIRPVGHVALVIEKKRVRLLKMYLEAYGVVAYGVE